jgi:malonyl-CoA O-methyltransferase
MDKADVIRNFSRSANLYDKYSKVQQLSASRLIKSTGGNSLSKILEIGCGTGNYTLLLKKRFLGARIMAIDISAGMIEVAKRKLSKGGIDFMVGDGEEHIADERFDLITSNSCFQWFNKLAVALEKYRGMLVNGGEISFSIFGPQTYQELNTVIKLYFNGSSITSAGFIPRHRLEALLKRNFSSVELSELRYKRTFRGLETLLKEIKYSGTRGNGLPKGLYLSRMLLKKMEDEYLKRFGSIYATYHIFICRGKAR